MTDQKPRRRQHRPEPLHRASVLGGRTSIHPFLHGDPDGHGLRSLSLLCLALAAITINGPFRDEPGLLARGGGARLHQRTSQPQSAETRTTSSSSSGIQTSTQKGIIQSHGLQHVELGVLPVLCDLVECEAEHVCILLREYKAWMTNMAVHGSYDANSVMHKVGECEKPSATTASTR